MLSSGPHRKELREGSLRTTNNRMELTAVIEALAALKRPSEVEVFTGPTARRQPLRYAVQRYGTFRDVQLEHR